MADFNEAYEATMTHEGGYANDVHDVGGETYKGVARKYYPDWDGWLIIDAYKNKPNFPKNLDEDEGLQEAIRDFYKKNYWDKLKCDDVSDQDVAEEMFDTSVNMGVSRAGRFLQESLNCLNRNQQNYSDIGVDGKVGQNTLNALNSYLNISDNTVLLKMLNVMQGNHYIEYMKKDPKQERFAYGWFSRVELKKKYGSVWKLLG